MFKNLLEETVKVLEEKNYIPEDVARVESGHGYCAWDDFVELAKDFNYDGGFGSVEVNRDLVIVMKNGTWFEREEYDGAEWWEYKIPPMPSYPSKTITIEERW